MDAGQLLRGLAHAIQDVENERVFLRATIDHLAQKLDEAYDQIEALGGAVGDGDQDGYQGRHREALPVVFGDREIAVDGGSPNGEPADDPGLLFRLYGELDAGDR